MQYEERSVTLSLDFSRQKSPSAKIELSEQTVFLREYELLRH